MDREPSYPADAPVGESAKPERESAVASEDGEEKPTESSRTRKLVAGAAIGVGSAALVAALLYANRSRKSGAGNDRK